MVSKKPTRYGVAQALLDGLATTEEGLAVRDILPDKDFEDKNGNAIGKRDWIQPWSGNWLNTDAQTEVQTYQTNKDVDNTQKVLCIYGIRATNIGPGDVSTTLNCSSIVFKRSSVKTIESLLIISMLVVIFGRSKYWIQCLIESFTRVLLFSIIKSSYLA